MTTERTHVVGWGAVTAALFGLLSAGCGGSSAPAEQPGGEPAAEAAKAEEAPSQGTPPEEQPASAEPTGEAEPAPGAAATAAPAAGSAAAAPGSSGDTRTPEVVQAFVKERRGPVRACVTAERKKRPGLGGDLVLDFVLTPEGGVTKLAVNAAGTTLDSPEAIACILPIVQAWRFPASSKGLETKVSYPFSFSAPK
jgi:hypothetical protein